MRVLIIGGGIAGLTAGIYAQMKGHNTTILEQHSIAGGNLTGWKRQGFYIDNCIHWLTGTNKNSNFYPLWKDIGMLDEKTEVTHLDSLFSCERDGTSLTLYRDLNKTVNEMTALSPEDTKEIKKLAKCIRNCMYISRTGGKNKNKGLGIKSLSRLIPSVLKYHAVTTGEYGKKFKNPIFYDFFTTLTGPDFSMMAFIMTAADFCSDNADIPIGGSLNAAQRILKKYKEVGGTFIPNAKVTDMTLEGKRITSVVTEDGTVYKADKIIATLEPKVLFNNLLHMAMPKKMQKQHDSKEYNRFSFLHAAFSIDKTALPFSGTLSIESDKNGFGVEHNVIYKEFSYDNFGKGNKTVVEVMTLINESICNKIIALRKNSITKYNNFKKSIAEYFKNCFLNHFPQLKDKNELEVIDIWTPASYNRYTGAEVGSFMSFSMPNKKVPVVIPQRIKNIKNLLLATQWQTAPGGLPIAAKHGKRAAEAL